MIEWSLRSQRGVEPTASAALVRSHAPLPGEHAPEQVDLCDTTPPIEFREPLRVRRRRAGGDGLSARPRKSCTHPGGGPAGIAIESEKIL
jgi:hypothetical protein